MAKTTYKEESKEELPKVILTPPDLDKDMKASAERVEELRAGRNLGDIPMNDEYFKARRKHMLAHGGSK